MILGTICLTSFFLRFIGKALSFFLIFFASFQQPFHCEIEHKIGLTCMTTGPVTCRVRLDRGGYVPGEAISIWATVTNNSKVTIKHTRASLTEVRTHNNMKRQHSRMYLKQLLS